MPHGSVKPSTLADSMDSIKSYSHFREGLMHICDLHKFTENKNVLYFMAHMLLFTLSFPLQTFVLSLVRKQSKSISPLRKTDHSNKKSAAGFN